LRARSRRCPNFFTVWPRGVAMVAMVGMAAMAVQEGVEAPARGFAKPKANLRPHNNNNKRQRSCYGAAPTIRPLATLARAPRPLHS
jgi:hypothetical protein